METYFNQAGCIKSIYNTRYNKALTAAGLGYIKIHKWCVTRWFGFLKYKFMKRDRPESYPV